MKKLLVITTMLTALLLAGSTEALTQEQLSCSDPGIQKTVTEKAKGSRTGDLAQDMQIAMLGGINLTLPFTAIITEGWAGKKLWCSASTKVSGGFVRGVDYRFQWSVQMTDDGANYWVEVID